MKPAVRTSLAAVWLAATAVAVAACSKSSSPAPIPIKNGAYEFTANDATVNSCWDVGTAFPPVQIGLPFTFATTATVGNATITMTPSASAAVILPTFKAIRTGNLVVASGFGETAAGGQCHFSIQANGNGNVVAPDTIDFQFTTTLAIVGSDNCAALVGTSFNGVPFPNLSPSCSWTYQGQFGLPPPP